MVSVTLTESEGNVSLITVEKRRVKEMMEGGSKQEGVQCEKHEKHFFSKMSRRLRFNSLGLLFSLTPAN